MQKGTEKGSASLLITLSQGILRVIHGNTNEVLHKRPAMEGDWEKLWYVLKPESKPVQHWIVEIPRSKQIGWSKGTIFINDLIGIKDGRKKKICLYSWGVALRKATLFGGKAMLLRTKPDKDKHYIA